MVVYNLILDIVGALHCCNASYKEYLKGSTYRQYKPTAAITKTGSFP